MYGDGYHLTQPPTWQDMATKASFNKGDYFEHDNKVYHQRDGKTYLVTDDASGDVELDGDQTARLEKARSEKAEREKAAQGGINIERALV